MHIHRVGLGSSEQHCLRLPEAEMLRIDNCKVGRRRIKERD